VIQLEGTLTTKDVYERRERRCDLGYLRTAFRTASGRVDFRCPAEPVGTFVKKGGDADDTVGRRCLCNALMSNVGHGQVLDGGSIEPGLFTAGDDLTTIGRFLAGRSSYSAADVIDYLLGNDTRCEI
jgi:hypothetical protein